MASKDKTQYKAQHLRKPCYLLLIRNIHAQAGKLKTPMFPTYTMKPSYNM